MAYYQTYDEATYGGVYANNAGDIDAPNAINENFVLSEGSVGYGATISSYGYFGDTDVYSLGTLSPGNYSLDVSGYNWDYYNSVFTGNITEFGVMDQFGYILANSYNEYTDVHFSLNTSSDVYAYVIGSSYLDGEYSLVYNALPTNSPAVFISGTYIGDLSAGSTGEAFVDFVDLDGVYSGPYSYLWFLDDSPLTLEQDNSLDNSVYLDPSWTGSELSFQLTFIDDAGNYEEGPIYIIGDVLPQNEEVFSANSEQTLITIDEVITHSELYNLDFDNASFILGDGIYNWGGEIGTAPNIRIALTLEDHWSLMRVIPKNLTVG